MTVSPGQTCTGCGRRVPHPRTPESPDSATMGVRGPADAIPSLKVMYEDLANGAFARLKYPRFAIAELGAKLLVELEPSTLEALVAEMAGDE